MKAANEAGREIETELKNVVDTHFSWVKKYKFESKIKALEEALKKSG
jgi:hypothetical protein